tara:strand:+ start:3728 stop:3907 length:180 start_codon:yes stop_codon:yes gene_type:complete
VVLQGGIKMKKNMRGQKHTCSNCGANGKDYGGDLGIVYGCEGDFESPCFQEYLSTIREA